MKTDKVVLRFICEQEGALEALPGFVVGRHHVPKFAGSRVTEFIRTVGDQFLQDESSTLFQRMRQVYGLKRRDVQTSQDPGSVSLRTGQLHVHVALQGHPAHIDQYIQRTTIVPQTSTDAQGDQFERFVGARVNRMEVVPEQSFDLESIIDLLEEKFSAEALKYPTDFSSCRVTHPQLPLQIHFEIKVLTLTAPIAAGPELFTQAFGVLRGSW